MIKLVLFVVEVFSQCGIIEPSEDFSPVDVQAQPVFSIGIWTKYQSLNIYVEYQYDSWTVIDMTTQSDDPVLKLIIDYDEVAFKHTWIYTSEDGETKSQSFVIQYFSDFGLYEGQWFLNHISADQHSQTLMFYLWPFGQDFQFIQNIYVQDTLQLNDNLYKASLDIYFQGYFSKIMQNIHFFSNQQLIDFIKDCVLPECQYQRTIIQDQMNFEQNLSSRFNLVFPINITNNYSIGQWFKINITQIENIAQIFIFGVKSKQMYLNGDFYQMHGDYSVFRIYLDYNLFVPDLNQFVANTYCYITPIPGNQRERVILKIPVQNIYYLKYWIYIEYQHFQLTSQVLIYYSINQQYQITKFDQSVKHFSSLEANVVYQLTFDQPLNQLLVGQIQKLNKQDCFVDQQYPLVCSISCGQCFGPLSTQCLNCNSLDETFRLFNPSTKSCKCIDGYIDTFEKQCKSISQIFGIKIITEKLSVEQQCKPGQFRGNNNKCFQCPLQYQESQNIVCGNCYEDPQQIKSTLLCTYDFLYDEENMSYQNITRTIQEYQFYLLNLDDGRYIYYNGAIGYCDQITQPNCYASTQINFNREISLISCLPNYISNQTLGFCIQCDHNCLICNRDTNICDKCLSQHTLFEEKCVECPPYCLECTDKNGYYIICSKCIEGYSNYGEYCQKCGSNCQICYTEDIYIEGHGFINRCVKCIDPNNYYVSSDGANCLKNEIPDCQIQYVYDDLTKQSSFDVYVNEITDDILNPQSAKCALCYPGYINTLNKCIYDESLSSTDQVIQINLNSYKITKSFDKDQLLKTTCKLDLCELCIFPYDQQSVQSRFCTQCQLGYYSHLIYGTCYQCPPQCYKCIHQHKVYKDAWKWKIKTFNYFILNNQNFNMPPQVGDSNYEAICTECINGLELYEGSCTQPCDPSCEKCIKQNGQNKCVKCKDIQQSIYNNKCIQCLNTCKFCIINQTMENIQSQTQNTNNLNQHCLIPQPNANLYYFNYNYKVCEQNDQCQKILNITLNVYCDQGQYELDKQHALDQKNFTIYNIQISDIFVQSGYSNFGEIEKDYLLEFYNQIQLDKAYYYLNIIPNQSEQSCYLGLNTNFRSWLKNKLQGLLEQHIIFFNQNTVMLKAKKEIQFQQFSSISFINVGFCNSPLLVNFIAIDNLIFKDSQLLAKDLPSNQTQSFVALDVKYAIFENVYIDIIKQSSKSIFIFNNPKIFINNMTISNINLTKTSVFLFYGVGGSLLLTNFDFQGYFQEASLIKINDSDTEFSISIQNGKLQIILDDNSSIFSCPYLKNVTINKILFQNSAVKLNSFIYQSLEAQILHSQFINLQLYSSFLYQSKQQGGSQFRFQNLTFNNISYDSQSFLINIIQSQGQIQLYNLEVSDVTNNFNTLDIYSLFTIQISDIIIREINVERTSGLNDFKLINTNNLIIQNVYFKQKESFRLFGLQTYDCLQRQLQQNIFQTGLNIRNFISLEIQNLIVIGIQTVNHPFIVIQQVSRSGEYIFTQLKIYNCQFTNNQILLTNIDVLTTLILIESDQQGSIQLNNITVSQNIMVDFIQDMFYDSTLFIVVDALFQNVQIDYMNMSQNYLVNSSQSVMRFKVQVISIENSSFSQQNLYNYQVLKQWLYFGFEQNYQVYHQTIQILFPQISQCGVSFIYARQIIINNSKFHNNRAMNGGSLYLTSLDLIQITNSEFLDSQAQVNIIQQYQLSEFSSSGGALYIVSESQNLTLIINNSSFIDCSANKQGGSIYLDLTSSDVASIQLENITIIDSISFQGSFLKLNQQQNKQNFLNLTNIQIFSTFDKLNQFLESILLTRMTDVSTFIQEGHLINTQFSNVFINQIFVHDLYFIGLLRLHNNNQIQLSKVKIVNVQIFTQQIIDIDQNQIQGKNSFFNQLLISNITQIKPMNLECVDDTELLIFSKENIQCFQNIIPQDLKYFISKNQIQNILNCALNKLSQFANNQSYLINYKTNMQQHNLQFKDLSLTNISNFQLGLFMISSISNQVYKNFIKLENVKVINCQCGLQGCLNIMGVENQRLLQQSNEIYQSLFQLPQTVRIYDSEFINNTASLGTLNINNVDILINNSIITNNIVQSKGGGIYYQGNKKLYVYFTKISKNIAQEGGAIYLQDYHQSQQIPSDLEIDSNVALQFSNGIAEFPKSLTIIMFNNQFKTQVIEETEFNYYEEIIVPKYKPPSLELQDSYIYLPSGQKLQTYQYFDEKQQQYLKYNLSLRIVALNSQNQIISNLNSTYCSISGKPSNEYNFSQNYFSQSKFLYDLETNSYNLDDLIIYFNPYQQECLLIQINCPSIKTPKYSNQPPYTLIGFYNNYKLFLKVKTFECQRGESYNQSEFSCKQCDASQQFYTVIPGGKCQIKNDINTKSLTSARLELRDGYWRPTETNDKISECYHLKSNCLGGWKPGDQSCLVGHIGALCEQCDIYNTRGDGKYSISKEYQCGNCNQIYQNVLIIFFISLWTLLSILITVKGTVETVQWTTQQIKLKKIGLRMEIYKESMKYYLEIDNSSILVKLFSNYILILASISTFQLDLPDGFGELVTNIGNPVQAMSYSLDCFLIDLTQTSIIYFRVIWAIIMPIIYSSAFITCYILIIKLKRASYSFSIISTSLIYIYAYMQPNLIGAFISLLSYRSISNILWIQGNVAYEYMTLTHYKWIYALLSPALFIFGFFIPFILFLLLRENKNNLNNPKFRMVWGYMYNEYLDIAYFWEIVKICQREIIIILLTFYQDQVMLKAALVFLVVTFYDILSKYYMPYKTKKMNHLDSNASLICASSIVSGQIIFAATQSGDLEITWPFYIFLVIINALFILKMLLLILQAYLRIFNNIIEQIKQYLNFKFPSLKYQQPLLGQILEPAQTRKQRLQLLIQKIRKALMPHARQISMFRKYTTQTISVSQLPKESKFYNPHTFLATPNPTDRFLVMDVDLNTKNQDDDRIIENQNIQEEEIEDSEPQFQRSLNQDSYNYVRQSIE